MSRRYVTVAAVLVCALLISGGLIFAGDDGFRRERSGDDSDALKDGLEGNRAPTIQDAPAWMNTPGDKPLSWSKLKGKVVLIDFWGVWCGPCRKAIPKLKALQEKYEDDGLVVLGIHTQSKHEDGPAYVREQEITYPIAFDVNGEVISRFHVDSYPDYYVVDRNGVLRFADLANSEAEEAVKMLLAEPAEDAS